MRISASVWMMASTGMKDGYSCVVLQSMTHDDVAKGLCIKYVIVGLRTEPWGTLLLQCGQ